MATIYNMKGTLFPSFSIGKKGTTILQGTAVPTGALGADGDLYIQHGATGVQQKLFQRLAGTWSAFQYNSVRLDQLNALTPTANSFVGTDAQGLVIRNVNQTRATLGLGTAASLDAGIAAGNVPVLGGDGKLTAQVMPAFSITDVTVVTTNAQRDALIVQSGDIAINTTEGLTYIYDGSTWRVIGYASSVQGIQGVNGVKAGVVSLDTTDILSGVFTTQRGGTGFASFAKGDLLVGTAGASLGKLSVGVDGKILTLSNGTPVWGDVVASQIAYTPTGAPHSVATTVQTALAELAGNRSFVRASNANPTNTDVTGYSKGDLWVNTLTQQTFIAGVSDTDLVWLEIPRPALLDKLVVVSPAGSDTRDGSFNSPVSTIGKAMTMVSTGGAILAMPGTYVENVSVNKPNVCLYGNNVTVQGSFSVPLSASGFLSRGVKYTNGAGLPVSVSGLNLSNVRFIDSIIEASSSSDYALSLQDKLGTGIQFINCSIRGVIRNTNTGTSPVTVCGCDGGFGVEMSNGVLSITGADEMAPIVHTGGALRLRNVGRILKDVSAQSIVSVATTGIIDLDNVSVRQPDGTWGSINFGACTFAMNDVDRDPTQNFNEAKRSYGRNGRDIHAAYSSTSYRADNPSITGHLTGLDSALGSVLGAAVKTFNDLHDTLDYTPADLNRVVKVNGDGTGINFGYVLGTASQNNTGDFATAAQGTRADTAVQHAELSVVGTAGNGSFLKLSDAPSNTYEGAARQLVRVRADEAGLEFAGPLGATAYSNEYGDLNSLPTLGTAAAKDYGDSAGQLPMLDANGKLNPSTMPALAITDVFVVADYAERDALTVQGGDVAKVTLTGQTFIYDGMQWVEMTSPSAVNSVNGKSGTIVLVGGDINVQRSGINYTAAADSIVDHFAGIDLALALLASKAELTSLHEEVSATYQTIESADEFRTEVYDTFQTQADAADEYTRVVATYETKQDATAAADLATLTYETKADAATEHQRVLDTYETLASAQADRDAATATFATKSDAEARIELEDATFATKAEALADRDAATATYYTKTEATAEHQRVQDTYYTRAEAQADGSAASGSYETKTDADAFRATVADTYETKTHASTTYETKADAATSASAAAAFNDTTYETKTHASDTYDTKTHVAATYETKTDAATAASFNATTYETKTHASDTYTTKTDAAATYETKTHASDTYAAKTDVAANYVAKAAFTAAGDLLVGTGAATFTKLGKGSNSQVLSVDANGMVVWAALPAYATSLAALTDVVLTSPVNGQALVYNGTKWVNTTINTSSATGDKITTGTTSVQTAEVANAVTVNANGKRVAHFLGGTSTGGDRLNVTSDSGKIALGTANTAGTGAVDLEFNAQGAGQVRFNLSGTASMRSGAGEALTIQPGDASTGNGVALTLIAGAATANGANGGDLILTAGTPGSGGTAGQIKISAGYVPTSVDSVITKSYVDNRRLDQLAPPTAAVNANGQFINNVRDPVLDGDAANRKFVVSRGSQFEVSLVSTSAVYDVAVTEHVILVKRNTLATTTVRLPVSGSVSVGKTYTIKDARGNSDAYALTIQGISGETIDGAATQVINQPYESITVIWNGAEWNII